MRISHSNGLIPPASANGKSKAPVLPQTREPQHNSRFYFASPIYSSQNRDGKIPGPRPGYLLDRYI